jgi:hypothetical protein
MLFVLFKNFEKLVCQRYDCFIGRVAELNQTSTSEKDSGREKFEIATYLSCDELFPDRAVSRLQIHDKIPSLQSAFLLEKRTSEAQFTLF